MSLSNGPSSTATEQTILVKLMGGFETQVDGTPVFLPLDAQRLVAFLALEGQPRSRTYVAGRLWSDGSQERASGNLRSALWRVRKEIGSLVAADSQTVSLFPGVRTDVREIAQEARRLTRAGDADADLDYAHKAFCDELLVGWYDEWTLVERERVRQLCLHALESIAIWLLSRRRYAQALEAALAAVALEPLRESSHRVIIQIHLAEGNHYEGVRHYEQFSTLLEEELGLMPSPIMERMLAGLQVAT
jgi:DNA-binding SARP family transcriptional activator